MTLSCGPATLGKEMALTRFLDPQMSTQFTGERCTEIHTTSVTMA